MADQPLHECVKLQIDNGIATVTLNRPSKLNALDIATFDRLCAVIAELETNNEVRAVVLTGAGGGFCAGLDISVFQNPATIDDLVTRSHCDCNRFQQAAIGWRRLPIPVIAAIHGPCLGGGLQLALAADVRVLHPEASLSVMEINWGLIPDMGYTQLAPKLIGDDRFRDLLITGRVFTGQEALDYGLATLLAVDPLQEALCYATEVARKSPHAIRAAKALANAVAPISSDGLLAESKAAAALVSGPNFREAVSANLEKRAPKFSDPA